MMLTKLLFVLSIISACGIVFVVGVTSSYYKLKPAAHIHKALDAREALDKKLPETTPHPKEIDRLLAKKKVLWNKKRSYNGVTLITLRYSTTAYLLDMKGNTVHRWDIPFYKIWPEPPHISSPVSSEWIYIEKAMAFPNGDLIVTYTAAGDTPYGYGMVKVDKDSNLIWKYSQNTHHDFSIDPDTGNILALTHSFQENMDKEYPRANPRILDDFVVILSPEGKEIKRFSVFEAFFNSPYKLLLNDYDKNTLAWDRLHTNSVSIVTRQLADKFPQFKQGQLLISLRNMDTIAVLNPQTRQIDWAYNGLWRAQHSPTLLPNGNILLLDNKGHVENREIYSRAIEFNPKTLGVAWSYIGKDDKRFFSEAFGRVQRLGNGNTLILESMNGKIFEVTPDKKIVWQYKIPLVSRTITEKDPRPYIQARLEKYTEEPLSFDPRISGIIVSATRYNRDALSFTKSTPTNP